MTKNIKLLTGILTMCLTAITAGCSSTEILDQPQNSESKGQTITLNITCPDAVTSTRADNDHVLRYSAVVYTGSELKTGELYERQETTVSPNSDTSHTFIFEVPNGRYSCVVFADYIPDNSIVNDNGLYSDMYYNTEDMRERIYMRSFIDFSTFADGNVKVDEKCFNNENYDCFAYYQENITKEDSEEILGINLERIVSRVAFKSTTDMPENLSISDITFKKVDFFGTHTIKDKSINNSHHGGSSILNLSSFNLNNPNYSDTGELFFFYTFASPKDGSNVSLYEFNFTVNYDDDSTYEASVGQSIIKPTPNYKITVMGPFLSPVQPVLGNLILNIPTMDTEQWEWESEKEITVE